MTPNKDAIQLIEDILELIGELPERAEAFGESVEEKVRNMWRDAEDGMITNRQMEALNNMKAGVEKWVRR